MRTIGIDDRCRGFNRRRPVFNAVEQRQSLELRGRHPIYEIDRAYLGVIVVLNPINNVCVVRMNPDILDDHIFQRDLLGIRIGE